jgi:hypothetical protein
MYFPVFMPPSRFPIEPSMLLIIIAEYRRKVYLSLAVCSISGGSLEVLGGKWIIDDRSSMID